jgi:hypothetical protein
MDLAGTSQRRRRTTDLCLIVAFFALLWLPTLDSLFHLDHAPTPNEKRLLNAFPKWSASGVSPKAYLVGIEAWFNDHFGFRKRLVRLHSKWKRDLFKDSSLADVIVGRDGWLFYGGGRMIDNHRGTSLLSTNDLRAWQELLETRRDWLTRRGIRYLFVIAPNKESIYPEHLPEWLATPGPTRKLDQFISHMRAHSTVEVMDLRPALLEAKRHARTYLFSDSHWNALGAFAGYEAVVRAIGRQLPGVEPLPLIAFKQSFEDTIGGDLADLLGQERTLKERGVIRLEPLPPLQPLEVGDGPAPDPGSGTRERRPRYTEQPGQRYRVLLFRDSFANAWQKLLGHNFSRVLYVWQQHWSAPLVEREHPDIVVDEMLERYFNERDPRELRREDALAP